MGLIKLPAKGEESRVMGVGWKGRSERLKVTIKGEVMACKYLGVKRGERGEIFHVRCKGYN